MPEAPRLPSNTEIAAALEELGDLYELDGAIVHRVVAYRTAAKAVRNASTSVAELALGGRATDLPGIGSTLQEKISALVQTGSIPAAEKLRARFPPGLIDLTALPGLGPKRARRLFEELGVGSLEALREAAEAHRLRELRGFGERFEAGVLAALAAGTPERRRPRTLLPRAVETGQVIVEGLRRGQADARVEVAGSTRRGADSVKDLDLVAGAPDPGGLLAALEAVDVIESVQRAGEAGARARTHTGLDVELRIVAPGAFGNLLQHLTGSGAHNVALRTAAVRRGLHISEYGILDDATGETASFDEETSVYEHLGLPWIPPELREGRGEIEAAAAGELPALVELADIRGDLHCHTTASDGRNTIEQMARAALERGYEYLAITDHSATHGFGNDVSPDALRAHIAAVREVDATLEGIRVLAGSEVNILPDGSPDYDDELLAELDWAIGSVHTAFSMGEPEMTRRMVAAAEHPLIDAIGHPTGRLIERRPPYGVDLEPVFEAAARTGTMVEINANPNRRDLDDVHARAAARAGVGVLIDSDAHGADTLENMRWGVLTARRAWLSAADVANTRSWAEFAPLRKRARR